MMIDIDHFKKINDIHGNLKGDEVLRSTAQIIKSGIRSSDIAGRYGGEEFLIYLSNVAPEYLFTIAEKVRKAVESQSSTGIPVTISIGASCGLIRENIESEVDGLIQKADIRLYAAKESGRNRVVVE
jgi:diguanylate cyclase (GGDEF)-like protein